MKSLRTFVSFFSIALAFGCIHPVAAGLTTDGLSRLEKAMRQEIAQNSPPMAGENSRNNREDRRILILFQLRSTIEQGEISSVEETLRQILLLFSSNEVLTEVENLRGAVKIEREAKENEQAKKMKALLDKTRKAVRSAQKAADLDDVIRDLSFVHEQPWSRAEQFRALVSQLQNARQFAVAWQDYVAHRTAGRTEFARKSIQSALSYISADILPRSEILEREAELKNPEQAKASQAPSVSPQVQLRQIMEKARTLDDLPAAIDAVSPLRGTINTSNRGDDPAEQLYLDLHRIRQCYRDFQAGMPTIVQVRSERQPAPTEATELATGLKLELLRLVVPRYLQVKEKPAADEKLDNYIERMMRLAFDQCDPRLIQRIYFVRNAINGIANSFQFPRGLESLLAARNQDDAGQFLPAVISYQTALRYGGELVPAESVGRRLAAIKAAHPNEYEAGMKKFLEQTEFERPHVGGANEAFTLRVPAVDATPQK